MKITEIKKKMKEYRDYYGGYFINSMDIDDVKTKEDLRDIINRHHSVMENMLVEAHMNLDNFAKKVGL